MHLVQPAPAEQIDRKITLCRGGQHVIDARVSRVCRNITAHHDTNGNCTRGCLPIRDSFRHTSIIGINRFYQCETIRIGIADRNRVACVKAIHGEGGNQDCASHAHRIHGLDHVSAGDLWRTMQHRMPRAAGMVAFIGMDLGVNDRHGGSSELAFVA